MTAEFESKLRRYMTARGIKTESEAIRQAVEEGLAPAELLRLPQRLSGAIYGTTL